MPRATKPASGTARPPRRSKPTEQTAADAPAKVKLQILRDGVFPLADIRKDKGDECEATADVATLLIERGHAKRL